MRADGGAGDDALGKAHVEDGHEAHEGEGDERARAHELRGDHLDRAPERRLHAGARNHRKGAAARHDAVAHVEHAGRHQARRREEGLHVRNRKRTDRIAAHVEPHEVAPLRVRNVARKKKPPDEEDDVREEPQARNEEHVSFDPDAVEVREDHARERDVHHQGADGRKGLVLQDVEAPEQIPEHDEYRQRHHLGEAVFHDCLPSFC